WVKIFPRGGSIWRVALRRRNCIGLAPSVTAKRFPKSYTITPFRFPTEEADATHADQPFWLRPRRRFRRFVQHRAGCTNGSPTVQVRVGNRQKLTVDKAKTLAVTESRCDKRTRPAKNATARCRTTLAARLSARYWRRPFAGLAADARASRSGSFRSC